MIVLDYYCAYCNKTEERFITKQEDRDTQVCKDCGHEVYADMPAPYGRVR